MEERVGGKANRRFEEALAFAALKHNAVHQERKGTDFPYVAHAIRVAETLDRFGLGDDVVVAGFLHDTTEDTDTTEAELRDAFGPTVAQLVVAASESDKSAPWRARKELTLAKLEQERDRNVLALIAADKLDNVRSLADTLRREGARTWERFKAGKAEQHWYYRRIAEVLLAAEPDDQLFRTLDYETQTLFPDKGVRTRFFAGKPFRTPHDARAYLADPIRHWKPDHSALELATTWIGARGVPPRVAAVLSTCAAYAGCELVEGFFEREVDLGTKGRASQTDLLALIRLGGGYGVIAVEGKAREPFGNYVRDWNTTAGTQARLDDLCARLDIPLEKAQGLRYQLLHRTASALIEARRYGAGEALMLVHSFDPDNRSLADYQAFANALDMRGADVNAITSPVVHNGVHLRLGWVKER